MSSSTGNASLTGATVATGTATGTSISLRQLRLFRPVDGREPDVILSDGGKYYGDVRIESAEVNLGAPNSSSSTVGPTTGSGTSTSTGSNTGAGGGSALAMGSSGPGLQWYEGESAGCRSGGDADVSTGSSSSAAKRVRIPHGVGTLLFPDGSRYGGEWRDGNMHGKGAMICDSFEYEGDWDGSKMHGFGTVHYKDSVTSVAGAIVRGLTLLSPFEQKHKPLEYRGEFHKTYHRHGRGVLMYKNGDVFEGEWSANRRHGEGTFRSHDGEKYVGAWVDDDRSGEGTVTSPNGAIYHGTMTKDCKSGHGTLVLPNGDEYTGNFEKDTMEGFGICKYRNGDKYEGEWHDGVRQGEGTFYLEKKNVLVRGKFVKGLLHGRGSVEYPGKSFFAGEFSKGERLNGIVWNADGGCYCGEWRGDSMHGKGIMWWSNGEFYYGHWLNGQRHGSGCINYTDSSEYNGEFSKDLRHGKGIYHLQDGSIQSGTFVEDNLMHGYIGQWNGRQFHGLGTLLYPNGDQYVGQFVNGVRHGVGLLTLKDGTVYQGEWCMDYPQGKGRAEYGCSGEIYEGQWVKGYRHGQGTVVHPDGAMFHGNWSDDVPHGQGSFWQIDPAQPIYEPLPLPNPATTPGDSANATADGEESVGDEGQQPAGGDADGENDDPSADAQEKKKSTAASIVAMPAVAAFAAASWVVKLGGKIKTGTTSIITRRPLADANQAGEEGGEESPPRTIIGYAPLYSFTGTFYDGLQRGPGYIFVGDSTDRVIYARWLEGFLKLEMPHRSGSISLGGDPCCFFCKATFGFFRKQLNCALCARPACSSCLKELSPVPPSVMLEVNELKSSDVATLSAKTKSNRDLFKARFSSSPSSEAAAAKKGGAPNDSFGSPVSTGKLPSPSSPATGPAISGALMDSVKACEECFQCARLNTVRVTVWERVAKDTMPSSASSSPLCSGEALMLPRVQSSSSDVGSSPTNCSPMRRTSTAFSELVTLCYKGFCADNMPHFTGTLWYGQRTRYHGDFSLGNRTGFGTLSHANGEEFVGHWSNDVPEGLGKYRSLDGTVYEGQWKEGQLSDLVYHGETSADLTRHGLGIALYPNGDRYNGAWVNGQRHGSGLLQFGDGSIYTGEFQQDQRTGRGRYIEQHSNTLLNSKLGQLAPPTGATTSIGTSSSSPSSSPAIASSAAPALPSLTLEDMPGGIYHGHFLNNEKHGQGVERFEDEVYTGTWANDRLEGKVKIEYEPEAITYESVWRNGAERRDIFVQRDQIADSLVNRCHSCACSFGLFLRRHHCRCCGGVFCDSCSKRKIALPSHFANLSPADAPEHRVCMRCYVAISEGCSLGIQRTEHEIYAGEFVRQQRQGKGIIVEKCSGKVFVIQPLNSPIHNGWPESKKMGLGSDRGSSQSGRSPSTSARSISSLDAHNEGIIECDGVVKITQGSNEALLIEVSSEDEIAEFHNWWTLVCHRCGIADFPLVLSGSGRSSPTTTSPPSSTVPTASLPVCATATGGRGDEDDEEEYDSERKSPRRPALDFIQQFISESGSSPLAESLSPMVTFDPEDNEQRRTNFVPAIVTPFPNPPDEVPVKPYPPAMIPPEAFLEKIRLAAMHPEGQREGESGTSGAHESDHPEGCNDAARLPFNYGTPPKPEDREYRPFTWEHWTTVPTPVYQPYESSSAATSPAASFLHGDVGGATPPSAAPAPSPSSSSPSSLLPSFFSRKSSKPPPSSAEAQQGSPATSSSAGPSPLGTPAATTAAVGAKSKHAAEMPSAAIPLGRPGAPTFPQVPTPPVIGLHLKPLEGPKKYQAVITRKSVVINQSSRDVPPAIQQTTTQPLAHDTASESAPVPVVPTPTVVSAAVPALSAEVSAHRVDPTAVVMPPIGDAAVSEGRSASEASETPLALSTSSGDPEHGRVGSTMSTLSL